MCLHAYAHTSDVECIPLPCAFVLSPPYLNLARYDLGIGLGGRIIDPHSRIAFSDRYTAGTILSLDSLAQAVTQPSFLMSGS